MRQFRRHSTIVQAAFIIAAWAMLLLASGCEKEDAPAPPQRAATSVQAAAPDHYLADGTLKPKPVAMTIAPQAPKPTKSLPPGASCMTPECHAKFAAAPHIHGPISEKACNACHDEDTGTHHFPLKRGRNETCTFCHAVAGTQAHQHKPIADGGCTTCHDPHVANAKFLLKADNVEQLCQKCHDVHGSKCANAPTA